MINLRSLQKKYVINLVGNSIDVEQASLEINQIAKSKGFTTKYINVNPNCIMACSSTNTVPEWRIKLQRELKNSNEQIIINKISSYNYESIGELNRSIRALTSDEIHPWSFLIDPNVDSRSDSKLLDSIDKMLGYNNPFNQVYPLKASLEKKNKELETYFDY